MRGSMELIPQTPKNQERGSLFTTTRWSVILGAQGPDSPGAQEALNTFCQDYWYPLFAYARSFGCNREEAEDHTQMFFARLLEKRYLDGVAATKGRFRAFISVAFRHFLLEQKEAANALKRGGKIQIVPFDAEQGDQRYGLDRSQFSDPARAFDARWAHTVLNNARATHRAEYEAAGHGGDYNLLLLGLAHSLDSAPFIQGLAAQLGRGESATRILLCRFRKRYAEIIRAEVRHTVEDPRDVSGELHYLLSVLKHDPNPREL